MADTTCPTCLHEAPFSRECQCEYLAKLEYHKRAEIASLAPNPNKQQATNLLYRTRVVVVDRIDVCVYVITHNVMLLML